MRCKWMAADSTMRCSLARRDSAKTPWRRSLPARWRVDSMKHLGSRSKRRLI